MKLYLIGVLVVLSLAVVSAEIIIDPINSIYNKGDEINISVTLSPSTNTNGFFSSKLVCSSGEVEIYKSPYSINAGQQKNVFISVPLDNFLAGNLEGNCHITANYASESRNSQNFEITKKISVSFDVDQSLIEPGSEIKISGGAVKANGKNLDGYIELIIKDINISLSDIVIGGRFDVNLTIPSNSRSGNHEISIKAYEKNNNGEIINEGSSAGLIKIKQIIKNVNIAIGEQTIKPGNELIYRIIAYDQANASVTNEVSLTLTRPDKSVFVKKVIRADESQKLLIEGNYAPGSWKIDAKLGDLENSKAFYVEEFQNVSFALENKSIIVTNVGNVVYNNPIEVMIGDVSEVIEIELNVGESKRFRLYATDGDYRIAVKDGDEIQELGIISLTGNSVRITGSNIYDILGDRTYFLAGWILLFLILGGIAFYYYRKVSKRSFLGTSTSDNKYATMSSTSIAQASQNINQGQKQECVVISLKIKNIQAVEKAKNAEETVNNALSLAKEYKAKIYSDRGYRTLILSPKLTNNADINSLAVKIAQRLKEALSSHNRKFAQKIEFGIGVNVGDLIVESQAGSFKFSSLGSTVSNSKKIAERANSEVLLSGEMYRKVIGTVKGEKIQGGDYWKINRIIERDQHSEFLKRFMNRNDSKPDSNNK